MAPFGFLLIIFIIHGCVGHDAPLREQELKASNIVAKEDIIESIKKFGPYWKSFGETWVLMPDGDGNIRYSIVENKTRASDKGKTVNYSNMDEKVTFYLYTPENPDGVNFTADTLKNLKIDSTLSTKIICHGWMADSTSSATQSIKDAFLARGGNNVIIVDWKYFSHDFLYFFAVNAVQHVGRHLGHMIDDLVISKDVNYEDIHLVGHSLGAHVAGIAGDSTKEKIGRITGLDPALPGFGHTDDQNGRLDKTDAQFVDIIHTCAGLLGFSVPIGHADFYPNGGTTCQPGCNFDGINLAAVEACSHSRSHQFFAESINPESKFIAIKCEDWSHFKARNCDHVLETMGQHISKKLNGLFYLKTNEESPFSMGINGTIY